MGRRPIDGPHGSRRVRFDRGPEPARQRVGVAACARIRRAAGRLACQRSARGGDRPAACLQRAAGHAAGGAGPAALHGVLPLRPVGLDGAALHADFFRDNDSYESGFQRGALLGLSFTNL